MSSFFFIDEFVDEKPENTHGILNPAFMYNTFSPGRLQTNATLSVVLLELCLKKKKVTLHCQSGTRALNSSKPVESNYPSHTEDLSKNLSEQRTWL